MSVIALDKIVKVFNFHEVFGPFRLSVDRVFAMKGFGSVVTGTSISGRTSVGEDLRIYPTEKIAKITRNTGSLGGGG